MKGEGYELSRSSSMYSGRSSRSSRWIKKSLKIPKG